MKIIRLSYVDFLIILKVTRIRIVSNPFLSSHFLFKCAAVLKKTIFNKTSLHRQYEITVNASVLIRLYTLFQDLISNTKLYNWRLYADIIRNILRIIIFKFSIRFLWLNSTYIIPNPFFWTIL